MGFRVLSPDGRLGQVRHHRYGRPGGDLEALIVEAGLFRRSTFELDADEIAWILPLGRRVLLNGVPAPLNERVRLPVADTCNGFTVGTLEGNRIGRVVGVSEACLVIESGRWPFQRLRAIPFTRAHVRETDQSVISLPAAHVVRHSPQVHSNSALDEEAVIDYYDAALSGGIKPMPGASSRPGRAS